MSLMGDRIKMKREENDLTMAELGAILGVQASAVNKWEKGHVSNIKRSTIAKMADLFDVNPVWLMGLEGGELAYYDAEIPTLKGTDHIKLDSLTLTAEESYIIKKYRVDEKFRNVVKALNGYEPTIPVLEAPPKKPNAYIPVLGAKKVGKIKKSKEDLA